MTVHRKDVIRQIITFAEGHAAALDLILGAPDADMPALIDTAAKRIADELAADNKDTALTLRWVVGEFPDGDPSFWSTPIGQEVFRIAGYGREVIPRPHVPHILGISRQRISQLEHEGALTPVHGPHEGPEIGLGPVLGISEDSVRRRWADYPPQFHSSGALDGDTQGA